jgi:UTP--glucose-1-phosphate uridylyltransferase
VSEQTLSETEAFVRLMRQEGLDERVIQAFSRLYRRYRQGDTGKIPWAEVREPDAGDIVPFAELEDDALRERGEKRLAELAVLRLNGGLGTTMKLERAKSLIAVREGLSFLDVTARQILALREKHAAEIPWLLMNSFRTRDDSLEKLVGYRNLAVRGLPLDFLQNKVPRIVKATALPASFAEAEDCWAPPGHGDLYLALWSTGLLEQLRAQGIRWVFASNVDNLGATVDPCILGYLDREQIEFAMEVTDKTLADIKGGTLIRCRGRLELLEGAQVEEEHAEDFQDIKTFSVFNTNNLWWRVDALLDRLEKAELELPMIVNPKTVHGTDVVQLETAMGAAVGCFARAVGIRVPRSRFAPVKATSDLLAVRSDAYLLDEAFAIRPNPERDPALGPPLVKLDDRYTKGVADFEARFPHPLSLLRCKSLRIEGDVRFGRGVRAHGDVLVRNGSQEQRTVPDGTLLGPGAHEL